MSRSLAKTLGAAAVICVAVACGSPGPAVPTATADPSGLNQFAPADYFDLLGGRLSLQAIDTNAPAVSDVTADGWKTLITKERRVGLAGLTQPEREIVLSGAIKAYFTVVSSARYSIEIPGSDKTASVTEVYSNASSPDKTTLIEIAERRVSGEGVAAKLGTLPRLSTDAPDDSRVFNPAGSDERTTTLEWSHGAGGWTCRSVDQTDVYSLVGLERFLLPALTDLAVGADVSVGGRRAVTFLPVEPARRSMRITLDEATLWPIKYEYVDQSGAVQSRITLTAVNADDSIPMPGDPSACVGQPG